jgi:hypothetical protein
VRRFLAVLLHLILWLFTITAVSALPSVAQRTVTQEAGSGRKIVLHYNAADKVVETDTLGPNGELLEKNLLEYRPNAYVPQSVNTSYWPNGKPHKVSQNSYDDNSNFLGELVQVYDETGKQIGGHRLTHDPQSNVFSCADWSTDSQSFKPRECPAGEESEGAPETAKKFTEQEVTQQLERAREAIRSRPTTSSASASAAASNIREVGLVLPSHVRPGERVSGSVVENPADYENMSQLIVTRFALPFTASGNASTLAGWSVEISGESPQPADRAISLTIPPGQLELAVMFRTAENGAAPVSHAIPMPRASRDKNKGAEGWLAPAICVKGQTCMVHGAFTGNSNKTFAAFADQPAKIVAETTTAAYIAIPAATDPGPRPLVIGEGAKAIAFPTVVSALHVEPDTRTLKPNEQLLMTITLDGAEEVPDAEWLPGNFPPSNLDDARKLMPGYRVPRAGKDDHEAEERREKAKKQGGTATPETDEGQGGEVLLVTKVLSSDGLNFRGAKNGAYVFRLQRNAFKMGEFKYKFVVDGAQGGSFTIQPYLIPMLAPIKGQEFAINPTAIGQ